MNTYEETQRTAFWIYLMVLVALGGILFNVILSLSVLSTEDGETFELLLTAAVLLIILPLVLNLLALRTEVQRDRIYVYLGLLFPMMWRRLPFDSIASVEVVQYRPIRDAGGWGYRYGRFNGRSCWYYNMKGNRGVLIVTRENKQHIIGSQQPEALAAAIIAALSR